MNEEGTSIQCPHRGKYTHVSPVLVGENVASFSLQAVARYRGPGTRQGWWMGYCNACLAPVLVADDGVTVLPTPQPTPTDKRIPEHIRADLIEAKKCWSVGALRACEAMARRAIQSACLKKGADSGKKLWEQIDQLAATGVITKDIKEWAHEVRHLGNDGAHPAADPAEDSVTKSEAEDALALAEQFLEVLFVTPAIAAERKKNRTT